MTHAVWNHAGLHLVPSGDPDDGNGGIAATVWSCVGMLIVWTLIGWWWLS